MHDYRWFEFVQRPLVARFPLDLDWVAGGREWAAGAERWPFLGPEEAERWLNDIRQVPKKEFKCPRVFVSHRQIDDEWALRIAWLSWEEGFDYWLDIIDLDPERNKQVVAIEQRLDRALSEFEKSVLTAAIIEMALLNCSHVLATMTKHTRGSMWVPYEYGRVKERMPVSMQASCWWDSTTLSNVQPSEYLLLGSIHGKEREIRAWMGDHKKKYLNCHGVRRGPPPTKDEPKALPTG